MSECIFCEIINGSEPSYTIYKDDYVTAFLDINPISFGHTLIVPNCHISRLDMIDDKILLGKLMISIVLIANKLISSGICEDFTLLQDNGEKANQDIMHVHFHIIPRIKHSINMDLRTDKIAAEKKQLLRVYNLLKED